MKRRGKRKGNERPKESGREGRRKHRGEGGGGRDAHDAAAWWCAKGTKKQRNKGKVHQKLSSRTFTHSAPMAYVANQTLPKPKLFEAAMERKPKAGGGVVVTMMVVVVVAAVVVVVVVVVIMVVVMTMMVVVVVMAMVAVKTVEKQG